MRSLRHAEIPAEAVVSEGGKGRRGYDVIHTVGPIAHGSVGETERQALQDCYFNCLHTATKNQLRTVAFPCISTGVYGYPPEEAVKVALNTVRKYLKDNPAQLDRVIFCVFLKSDEDLYNSHLPAYFPKAGDKEFNKVQPWSHKDCKSPS
ncbi:O-acetyl-ADP-ribose deacetylase MACROD1 isoform X1 [Silurus asotus]|uniref:O-acetyl-ADP-ribose deacetylase MACROD1 isoform X1 n=1 Tax=Silurus asotus TaxID=30991 RepID=A0AAD5AVI3_SILAS|nr:O-acetyl-ADP-ribose deacetylase MACROD1 isoform X1 [Silurus asotus]